MSNSSSWPWPSSATTPSTSPGWRSNETSCSFVPAARLRAAMRGDGVGRPGRRGAFARPRGRSPTIWPSISSTIRSSEPGRHVDDADRLALAQDRGPVAHRGDLDHAVGDEDDRPLAAALAADDLEHALGQVRRQRRGHLVEHQHVGLDGQRAGEVDDAQRRQRHAARPWRTGRGRSRPSSRDPVAERLERRLGEAQVRPDVEIRDERRLLVDGDEAAPAGLGRRVDDRAAAADGDRAAVGPDGAGEDLDEGALAGAVGAHQRVDLAGADRERGGLQRDDRAVRLGDAGGLEQEVGARSSVIGPLGW